MSDHTTIEWTDATWTPIRARRIEQQLDGSGKERIGWHCEHLSEGCRNCYAERINQRLGTGREFKPSHLKHMTKLGDARGDVEVFLDAKMLSQPLRWKRPRMIFVCSMTDAFAGFVTDDMLDRMFAVMAEAHWHTFQVLTKRAGRMRAYMYAPNRARKIHDRLIELAKAGTVPLLVDGWDGDVWPLPNVWLGVSAEDQPTADERVVELLAVPAHVRFLSIEPMLGPITLDQRLIAPIDGTSQHGQRFIDWVIAGGESGPQARPAHPDWFRSLRAQCAAANVPFLFKQWGEWSDACRPPVFDSFRWPQSLAEAEPTFSFRIGKKAAGRLLDGVEHNGFPS